MCRVPKPSRSLTRPLAHHGENMKNITRSLILCTILAATPALADDVDAMLTAAAHRHGIDPRIVHAVALVESTKRCGVHNAGSYGIMQVQRGTAKEVGVAFPFRSCEDEIEAGVRYLRKAIDKGGDGCKGISLYNIGLNNRPICTAYGRKVMNKLRST